jgi:NAD(P)-dependent dehydrogenase (short-subunit alcohol dehydrogenase family)
MAAKFERTILITGGSAGLGYYCAAQIARQRPAYQIIIASRTEPEKTSAASINTEVGEERVLYMRLDLSNLKQIRTFVAEFEQKNFPPLAALVLNAGLQFPSDVTYTVDGFEAHLQSTTSDMHFCLVCCSPISLIMHAWW